MTILDVFVYNHFTQANTYQLLLLHHVSIHSCEFTKGVQNVMRLDNPELVPQHRQPALLFWSASLGANNEWGAWSGVTLDTIHTLRIEHGERVCMHFARVCVCGGAVSAAPPWSECVARSKPRDKRTEVLHAFANGCSAVFENPSAVSWRLAPSSDSAHHHHHHPPTGRQ